ncbi:phospholipid transporting ATPase IF [Echinococcus multilocularis]|uniref:Phospholipid-transporting ATPase n=1 Tax=Echinococcus multilocularis TaxID=6211 RepID=A0A087VXZ7_ECHMU|nr:phospholipid transporting ATPase IF [Echinococcus multilocularis]
MKCFRKLQIKLGIHRPPWPENREIPVGPISQAKFVSEPWSLEKLYGNNEISTSRYTWYGFVFQNLEEQAQRIANFYFLCIAIVQLFTDSPVSPVTSILPLAFVILLTMVKQGYEDFLRHKADREINSAPVQLVNSDGTLVTKKAFEISVGDIVLQRANDTFPCDLVLLSSSESNGECYVTTASLDGETNLKRFVAISATKNLESPETLATQLEGTITCQQPVDDFYKFYGRITVRINGSESTEPLGPECLLLRGARLRDTDFIYGVAVYTGPDTKMSLNSKGKQTKYSQVERQLNTFLVAILGLLVTISILYTILQFSLRPNSAWYVVLVKPTTWIVVQEFLGFLVLFNYIIPISLYVTIEFQKFFGSMFFGWDIQMYDEEIGEPSLVNTSDILEELGQVEYLFSDKTGTLTENCMVFQRFSVSSGTYYARNDRLFPLVSQRVSSIADIQSPRTSGMGIKPTEMPEDARILFLILALCHTVRVEREIEQVGHKPVGTSKLRSGLEARKKRLKQPLKLITDLKSRRAPPRRQASIMRRASAMQSAEDAISSLRSGTGIMKTNYDYQASSPDEKAFVESCRDFGIVYHGIDPNGFHVVTVFDQTGTRYRVLDVLGFDSDRKCMSVVLQAAQDGGKDTTDFDPKQGVVILCKGAETSILPRCGRVENMPLSSANGTKSTSDDLLSKGLFGSRKNLQKYSLTSDFVTARVTDFASAGLRTLVMGARYCPPKEWIRLKADLDAARGRLEGRDEALAEAYKAVERDLVLVGCTGIEDKLQEGVPETLTALREAGIQVWVLTGDKEETAVNISFSAGHFAPGLPTVRVTQQNSLRECIDAINTGIERVQESQNLDPDYAFGLVIDGHSLNYALSVILKDQFLNLCQMANSVLCCRLTPIQKAEIVRMMKGSRKPSPVCCAIGDGANDVSMILEAHVGIGLFGKEGRQAVRASDYALGRFRFLKRALLFHGFHYYVRTANLVQYFFYKNLVFTLTQVLFGIFSLFSSQSIYANIYLLLYNITMTSIPIIFYGIFEQRLPEIALMSNAEIYKTISKNRLLWWRNFFTWLSFSLWHGLVIFFGTYFLATEGVSNGGNGGNAIGVLEGFGSFMIDCVFITVNIKLMLASYHFNVFLIVSVVGTLLVNFAVFILCNYVMLPVGDPRALLGVWTRIGTGLGSFISYFGLFVLFALCFVPDLLYRLYVDKTVEIYFQNAAKSSEVTAADESSNSYNGAVNGAYYGSLDYSPGLNFSYQTFLALVISLPNVHPHQYKARQVDPSAAYLRRIHEEQVARAGKSLSPDYTKRSFNVFFTNTASEIASVVIPEDDPYFVPQPTDSSEYRRISPRAFLQKSS